MKNNTLTKINNFFLDNINYYFHCLKKTKESDQIINENENDRLLVQTMILDNRYYLPTKSTSKTTS